MAAERTDEQRRRQREWLRAYRARKRDGVLPARRGHRSRSPAGALEKAVVFAAQLLADPLERRTRRQIWTLALETYEVAPGTPIPAELEQLVGPARGDLVAHQAVSRTSADSGETKLERAARLRRAARREARP